MHVVSTAKHAYDVEEGEGDDQVGRPVKATAEGERSSAHLRRENFTQHNPRHWNQKKQKQTTVYSFWIQNQDPFIDLRF